MVRRKWKTPGQQYPLLIFTSEKLKRNLFDINTKITHFINYYYCLSLSFEKL